MRPFLLMGFVALLLLRVFYYFFQFSVLTLNCLHKRISVLQAQGGCTKVLALGRTHRGNRLTSMLETQ